MLSLPVPRRQSRGLSPFYPMSSFFDGLAALNDWMSAERMSPRDDGGTNLDVDLPGFKPEEINVEVRGRSLRLSAISDREGAKRRVSHVYDLGHEIDEDAVSASYEAGVLSLGLPAKESSGRRITINGSGGASSIGPGATKNVGPGDARSGDEDGASAPKGANSSQA